VKIDEKGVVVVILNLKEEDSVEIFASKNGIHKTVFRTKIVVIKSQDTVLTMPVLIGDGYTCKMQLKTERGLTIWDVVFEGKEIWGKLALSKFRIKEKGRSIQRRENFRLPVSLPMEFYYHTRKKKIDLIEEEEIQQEEIQQEEIQQESPKDGLIVDISGGGCAFMTDEKIESGKIIEIEFLFRDIFIEFSASIIDSSEMRVKGVRYNYKYRAKWLAPENIMNEQLVQLIFQQQREDKKPRKN